MPFSREEGQITSLQTSRSLVRQSLALSNVAKPAGHFYLVEFYRNLKFINQWLKTTQDQRDKWCPGWHRTASVCSFSTSCSWHSVSKLSCPPLNLIIVYLNGWYCKLWGKIYNSKHQRFEINLIYCRRKASCWQTKSHFLESSIKFLLTKGQWLGWSASDTIVVIKLQQNPVSMSMPSVYNKYWCSYQVMGY